MILCPGVIATSAMVLLGLASCSGSADHVAVPAGSSAAPSAATAQTGAESLPARWWIWVEASAPDDNPVDDATGAECAANQPTDVWFLAGTHGGPATRACTIPAGRPIYFPVINQICSVPASETTAQALASCAGRVDSSSVSLDGKPLRPAEATSRTVFTFVARSGSSTGFTAGAHRAVAWGLWVGPMPLTVGRHVLRFAASSGSFSTKVVYRLTVAGT